MKIMLENVNLSSTSGPNHFASKLYNTLKTKEISFVTNESEADCVLAFIESPRGIFSKPTIQRLDGIYFNSEQDYNALNGNIRRTYELSQGVVFQSEFNKKLTKHYFGEHNNSVVIHNGADLDFISQIKPFEAKILDKYENVWSCASSWRPHKRLNENIRYFLEHAPESECLIIAGDVPEDQKVKMDRIFYVGNLAIPLLISLYKRSKYFLHLAWLDHCPNVVVDARASGCKIICSSSGGTREVAGKGAILIEEDNWDFSPLKLYRPPKMNFQKKLENEVDSCDNIQEVGKKYYIFLKKTLELQRQ